MIIWGLSIFSAPSRTSRVANSPNSTHLILTDRRLRLQSKKLVHKKAHNSNSISKLALIKGLVDYIKPTIMNLIERQRLNYITNGTLFTKQKKIPGTTKTIFVRLSPNKKTICYGDWKNDNTIPDIDQLPGKMAIR